MKSIAKRENGTQITTSTLQTPMEWVTRLLSFAHQQQRCKINIYNYICVHICINHSSYSWEWRVQWENKQLWQETTGEQAARHDWAPGSESPWVASCTFEKIRRQRWRGGINYARDFSGKEKVLFFLISQMGRIRWLHFLHRRATFKPEFSIMG